MTTSPPDISSLTLAPQRQPRHDPYDQQSQYNDPRYHYQTSPPVIPGQYQSKNIRAGLPSAWMESSTPPPDARSLSPPQASEVSSGAGSPPSSDIRAPQFGVSSASGADDEIIPTAIVIKNIPFNVKRETLLDIIASLSIPTPYAFNYHLDQAGSFRGLAFANFRVAADADAVVAALNGFDVQGRKLRVEYKKVLQASEKERIEREKAIRRMKSMQMEKENQQNQAHNHYDEFGVGAQPPVGTPARSFAGSMHTPHQQYSPPHHMPVPQPYMQQPIQQPAPMQVPSPQPQQSPVPKTTNELDLNDPSTLEIYSRILLFKDDHMRDELAFSRSLSPKQRRVVHLVAQKLGVYHYSVGEGDERYAVVTRLDRSAGGGEQQQQPTRGPARHMSSQTLSRSYLTPTSSSPSSFLQSPSTNGQYSAAQLRSKKSMPDMKTLHTSAPRLSSRASNGNIREYATISSPPRRSPGGAFNALFSSLNNSGSAPPVPLLNLPVPPVEGPSSGGVVRQPRGPGAGGFGVRSRVVTPSDSRAPGGLDTRSHEPLEI